MSHEICDNTKIRNLDMQNIQIVFIPGHFHVTSTFEATFQLKSISIYNVYQQKPYLKVEATTKL